ncbi:hypothetical protein RHGRI_017417 [Rhododendron griersonianum]|uniref:Uncharacterized protein n=1 Tax=Rhododendron griersonianum TaxID=479676 RepID=A0AAV6JXQ5_9ERIC|nr:hypothetical protein RHGRI_017417 [Rhododendron griersonianum]
MPLIILLTPSPPAVDHPHPSRRVAIDHHHSRHSCRCSSSSVRRGEEGADVVSLTIVSQIERENRGPPQQEFLVRLRFVPPLPVRVSGRIWFGFWFRGSGTDMPISAPNAPNAIPTYTRSFGLISQNGLFFHPYSVFFAFVSFSSILFFG